MIILFGDLALFQILTNKYLEDKLLNKIIIYTCIHTKCLLRLLFIEYFIYINDSEKTQISYQTSQILRFYLESMLVD